MGKVVTIYLYDEETRGLKDFCDENQCTQYSALKTAVRQLLYSPLSSIEDESQDTLEEHQEKVEISNSELDEIPEKELSLAEKIRIARAYFQEVSLVNRVCDKRE